MNQYDAIFSTVMFSLEIIKKEQIHPTLDELTEEQNWVFYEELNISNANHLLCDILFQ
jgi:hypothetical protein